MRASELPDPLPQDPLPLAAQWFDRALAEAGGRNPNAMALATVGTQARPSVRIVLCKGFAVEPGYLVFYTNYHSRKGRELERNARTAAVMYWDGLGRQMRFEGPVSRSPAEESDAYFASRPWQSRISAWASDQSQPIDSLPALDRQLEHIAERFGATTDQGSLCGEAPGAPIARPEHWGGFRLWIDSLELWLEGAARLHERIRWQRSLRPVTSGFAGGPWTATRLQP